MVFSPPTFKTATPTSRTQLKLQLMREQLQEQERREAEFRQNLQQQRPTAAPPRPVPSTSLSTIGVDVPPQVLQVCSYLVIAHPFSFIAVSRSPSFSSSFTSSSYKYFSCTYKCNDTSNYLYAYLSLLFRSLLSQIYIRERFIYKLLKVTQNCGVVFLFAQKYRSKDHVINKIKKEMDESHIIFVRYRYGHYWKIRRATMSFKSRRIKCGNTFTNRFAVTERSALETETFSVEIRWKVRRHPRR